VFSFGYKDANLHNDIFLLLKRIAMILIGATLAYYTSLVRGIAGFVIISFGLLYHYKK
jgi:hypothetical protein